MDRTPKDFLQYKLQAFTLILLLSYAVIHVKLTGVYIDATLDQWFNFTVRLPFGQRILMPILARGIASISPLDVTLIFFMLEFVFVALFYFILKKLMATEFPPRQAQILSWLLILILPLITVINYRDGEAAFYYPYDTASLLFIAGGILFCLQKRWVYFFPWLILATLNRESSILLVLLIPALHYRSFKTIVRPFLLAIVVYAVSRAIVLSMTSALPGPLMEWFFRHTSYTYLEVNLLWLFGDENLFVFLFCVAGIPLLWFTFYDYIPWRYRPLRYVGIFYFLGLLLVGNFMEARIFAEIVVLIYLPVCVAIKRWLLHEHVFSLNPYEPTHASIKSAAHSTLLQQKEHADRNRAEQAMPMNPSRVVVCPSIREQMQPWIYYINRYAILLLFSIIVVFRETWQKLLGAWLS